MLLQQLRENDTPQIDTPEIETDAPPLENTFLDIESAISQTQERHMSLGSATNIDSLNSPNTDPKTAALALRYALLNAEKKAQASNLLHRWNILEEQLTKIAADLSSAKTENTEEDLSQHIKDIQALKKELEENTNKIEDLERQKNLLLDLRKNWEDLAQSENTIVPQLVELIEGNKNRDEIAGLLKQLHNGFEQVNGVIAEGSGENATSIVSIEFFDNTEDSTSDADKQEENQVEMLTNITKEQGELIAKLQGQLDELNQDDLLEQSIEEVDRVNQMMKESESCIQQLEIELHDSSERLTQFEKDHAKLTNQSMEKDDRIAELETNLTQHHVETTQLTQQLDAFENDISSLSEKNIELTNQLETTAPDSLAPKSEITNNNVVDLEGIIMQKQYEIYKLEEKHVSIESRYLQLYQRYNDKTV
ncbi:MAG: hypothetical protein JKY67_13485 [Pseudomonadales bacterium]|nr:hypothetical protein [Pseudomonadales bacterium]